MNNKQIALLVLDRHLEISTLNHYAGLVTLTGLVQLAHTTGDSELVSRSVELLKPFYEGKIDRVGGAYDKMYRCGGNASAFLVKYGYAPEALPVLVAKAGELIGGHPRDRHGIFRFPGDGEKIWIDTLFGVCPFLAIIGKLANRPEFVEEAVRQIVETDKLLFDSSVGLYNQAVGFVAPGVRSEDHWSRGNGWGALALADVLGEFPDHQELRRLYLRLMEGCVRYQDNGLWHQEMTNFRSYVETSGSALILYAMGRGLELGILSESYRAHFIAGLKSLLSYIGLDGSVSNACRGCLSPGDGSKAAYMAHEWMLNDVHAFGPPILAFAQAVKLNIMEI